MKEYLSKYHWLWNAAIVLIVSGLVFYFDPVWNAYRITHTGKDGGILSILVIVSIITVTAAIIALRHYWKWVVAATFCVTFASRLNGYIRKSGDMHSSIPYTYQTYIWESAANGLVYLAFALSSVALVRYIRKRTRERK